MATPANEIIETVFAEARQQEACASLVPALERAYAEDRWGADAVEFIARKGKEEGMGEAGERPN
jgi:hypothetical protein